MLLLDMALPLLDTALLLLVMVAHLGSLWGISRSSDSVIYASSSMIATAFFLVLLLRTVLLHLDMVPLPPISHSRLATIPKAPLLLSSQRHRLVSLDICHQVLLLARSLLARA